MPGRGQYWKVGGINDLHVTEADLDTALQAKVNSGGGGGLFYASVHWGTGDTATDNAGSLSPLLGVQGTKMGEQGSSMQGNFGRACKITNFVVRVDSHGVGTTTVALKKNDSTVKSYTFSNSDIGTTVTDSTETTFNSTDLIFWNVNSIAGSRWTAIVEYDFS